jgi:hypothetical protein
MTIKFPRVEVDNEEITGYQWLSPERALRIHGAKGLPLSPPTYVILHMISDLKKTGRLNRKAETLTPLIFTPTPLNIKNGTCFLYEGDAGYDDRDLNCAGSRHRLWAMEGGWRYERSEWDTE